MYNIDINNIGNQITYYRKNNNISMEALGNMINKSKTTISRYESGEIIPDMLTVLEICNALNIDINDLLEIIVKDTDTNKNENPFSTNLLYLYYISKNGIVVSSIEIDEKKYASYIIMKNGLTDKSYKQEYTGILECNYNTAFFCLTNAITNPRIR